jgi:hypothetical protein
MDLKKFNYDDYLFMYDDIRNNKLSKKKALEHYVKIGFKEKRKPFLKSEEYELFYSYNWIKYINDNYDLKNLTAKQAWLHWITYGKNENREIYKLDFDHIFYLLVYPDLNSSNIKSRKDCINHWFTSGHLENRQYNRELMDINYNKNLGEISNNKEICNSNNKFNILIRHCYRPNKLKKIIESIENQNYNKEYIKIFLCYDDKKSEKYLDYLKIYEIEIEYFYINISGGEYKYELYCNELMNKVSDGWIIFIDDDDMFLNNHALSLISNNINNEDSLIIWKYLRSDKIIFPKNKSNIEYGEIANSSYTFHSKYKKYSQWIDVYGGDYKFFNKLVTKINFNIIYLDSILVGIQSNSTIFGRGKNEFTFDIDIKGYIDYENISKLSMNYISRKFTYEIDNVNYLYTIDDILNENIENKNVVLTICQNLYPPAGGGEEWLLDFSRIINDSYYNIALSIKEPSDHFYFNIVDLEFTKIIEIPFDLNYLINTIRLINPYVIHHQGNIRYLLSKISYLLGIKMITGFCFWNNVINFNSSSNINMINRSYKKCSTFDEIYDNCICYTPSKFMNEIIYKICNKHMYILENISNTSRFLINNIRPHKYVSILNCNFLKGGQEFLYLIENLDSNIPLLGVISEPHNFDQKIIESMKRRNKINNINKLYFKKINNIREIYEISNIVLIPSLVDETYCKVAYEAMYNNIKTISYDNGNLKYLLKNYNNNTFIENPFKRLKVFNQLNLVTDLDTLNKWLETVNKIYYIIPNINIPLNEINIKKKLTNLIELSKIRKKRKSIGIFCPFVDQGLGIQCREYYEFLRLNNFEVCIFSHKPYIAKQSDSQEWEYDNVYYSNNFRENVKLEEILEFVYKYNVKIILIPEICFHFIFNIIKFFKMLNVKVITIINIETLRFDELNSYSYIDEILCNNISSYRILSNIFLNFKVELLEFNNLYFKKYKSLEIKTPKKIILSTFGGLNSFVRKNIDKTYSVFKKLEELYNYNYQLNIYIQGGVNTTFKDTNKIKYKFGNFTYNNIINFIRDSDIIIHLGDHEGLGLGFFEALNNNKPIITLKTYPNIEYVEHEKNGFIIDCTFEKLSDNNVGIVNRAILDLDSYLNLISKILSNEYYDKLIKIINNDKWIENKYINNFNKILESYE